MFDNEFSAFALVYFTKDYLSALFANQFPRRPIEERVVTALGKHWHIEHFACAKVTRIMFLPAPRWLVLHFQHLPLPLPFGHFIFSLIQFKP